MIIEAETQVSDCKIPADDNSELTAENQHRQQGNTVVVTNTNPSPPPPNSSALHSLETTTMPVPSDTKDLTAQDLAAPSPESTSPSPPLPQDHSEADPAAQEDPAAKKIQPPDSSCVFCLKPTTTLSPLDALQHTVKCFYSTSTPTHTPCPICLTPLPHLAPTALQSSLLHLQKCQRGTLNIYDPIETDDFEALYSSLCGRAKMVEHLWRRLNGRLGGARKREGVKEKLERKRNKEGRYECGESPLRGWVGGDGEVGEAWRTEGNGGRGARCLFPVVGEEEEDWEDYVEFEMF